MRTLLVDISGDTFALPLAYMVRTCKLPASEIRSSEGRQYFHLEGRQIGLVTAHQILGRPRPPAAEEGWPVVVIGQGKQSYGLVVDRFLGERELVVLPLDKRLGKIQDVAAGALMEDGSPVLILDVDDLLGSIERHVDHEKISSIQKVSSDDESAGRKRVLIVDDSATVRELERKILTAAGYDVQLAIDGMDGWNVLRMGEFHLVISDIDMPRMDGLELIRRIKQDPRLKSIPTMIVSYKDRQEDHRRGLEAGADGYMAKGGFHDETFLKAVRDLLCARRTSPNPRLLCP